MNKLFKSAALAAAATAGMLMSAPASAAPVFDAAGPAIQTGVDSWNQYRYRDRDRRGYRGDRYYRGDRGDRYYRGRTWRGRDGRYYCRRSNGTTGLLIGGAAGALLGREIDGGYNRTTGTVLGAAAGALLGREVDRGGSRCR